MEKDPKKKNIVMEKTQPIHNENYHGHIASSDYYKCKPIGWKYMEGSPNMRSLLSHEYQRLWMDEQKEWHDKTHPVKKESVNLVKKYVAEFTERVNTSVPRINTKLCIAKASKESLKSFKRSSKRKSGGERKSMRKIIRTDDRNASHKDRGDGKLALCVEEHIKCGKESDLNTSRSTASKKSIDSKTYSARSETSRSEVESARKGSHAGTARSTASKKSTDSKIYSARSETSNSEVESAKKGSHAGTARSTVNSISTEKRGARTDDAEQNVTAREEKQAISHRSKAKTNRSNSTVGSKKNLSARSQTSTSTLTSKQKTSARSRTSSTQAIKNKARENYKVNENKSRKIEQKSQHELKLKDSIEIRKHDFKNKSHSKEKKSRKNTDRTTEKDSVKHSDGEKSNARTQHQESEHSIKSYMLDGNYTARSVVSPRNGLP